MNFERIELLIQKEGVERLRHATVMVVGVGGVGSFCIEALARSGIGHLIIVDGDVVDETNLNRQIHATDETIGKSKVEVMKERILSYYNECIVDTKQIFYNHTKNEELFTQTIDYVVDGIDTMSSKMDLIEACKERNIPFISSMGMANRFDPTKVCITTLDKTSYDPVAKVMRNLAKQRRVKGKIPVVFSTEQPFIQHQVIHEDKETRKAKMPPASTIFVPATAGLTCASYVVNEILKKE